MSPSSCVVIKRRGTSIYCGRQQLVESKIDGSSSQLSDRNVDTADESIAPTFCKRANQGMPLVMKPNRQIQFELILLTAVRTQCSKRSILS